MSKKDHSNDGFDEAMDKATPSATGNGKLVPEDEYKEAQTALRDVVKDAPDPKKHVFKFVPHPGKVLIYAPTPKTKAGIELSPVTIAELAQEQKEGTTYKVYAISSEEPNYVVGDMVYLTHLDGWIPVNVEGFNMKIIENYQILGRTLRDWQKYEVDTTDRPA